MKITRFTLVELLVVIAIISILASLLLPVLQTAQENALQVSCLSNVKQIGVGVLMYNSDYNDFFPAATAKGSTVSRWKFELGPYLDCAVDTEALMQKDPRYGIGTAFACSAFRGVQGAWKNNYNVKTFPSMYTGLAWSGNISYRGDISYTTSTTNGRVRMSNFVRYAEETAIFGDALDGSEYDFSSISGQDYNMGYLYYKGSYDIDRRITKRHLDGLNILWADGHVSWMAQFIMGSGKNSKPDWYYAIHN